MIPLTLWVHLSMGKLLLFTWNALMLREVPSVKMFCGASQIVELPMARPQILCPFTELASYLVHTSSNFVLDVRSVRSADFGRGSVTLRSVHLVEQWKTSNMPCGFAVPTLVLETCFYVVSDV